MRNDLRVYKNTVLALLVILSAPVAQAMTCSSLLSPAISFPDADSIYQTEGLKEAIAFLEVELESAINDDTVRDLGADSLFFLSKLYREDSQILKQIETLRLILNSFTSADDTDIRIQALGKLAVVYQKVAENEDDLRILKLAVQARLDLLELAPNNYPALKSLLDNYISLDDRENALKIANRAYIAAGENGHVKAQMRILRKRARLEFQLKLYDQAERSYLELKEHPDFIRQALEGLTDVLIVKEEYNKAVMSAQENINLNQEARRPRLAPYLQLIDIYIATKRWDDAIDLASERYAFSVSNNLPEAAKFSAKIERIRIDQSRYENTYSGYYDGLNPDW